MIIAIDGPAGVGKSTIARLLSQRMQVEYIDSGAFYRSLTFYSMQSFGVVEGKEDEVAQFFTENPDYLEVTWVDHNQKMAFPEKDISDEIRTPEVTRNIRYIANHPACRDYVNQRMRSLAENYSFVIDGRDIGTVVFPDAKNKFYLDATPEIRATRRAKETNLPLEGAEFQTLCDEIISRDKSDMEREIAPLKKADSAKLIDTSDLSIEGVLDVFIAQIQS